MPTASKAKTKTKTSKKAAAPKKKPEGAKKPAAKKASKKLVLTRQEKLEAHRQGINAMYKAPVIQRASEFSNTLVRRPTGITSLDLAINGGLPAGGLTELIGPGSVGKDYLVNKVVANVQQIYGKDSSVCFCMTEMHFDKTYAKECGFRVSFTKDELAEWEKAQGFPLTEEQMVWATDQIGEVDEVVADNAEQLLEIAAQSIATNLYQVVVINSIGALLTKAEETAEGGIEDKHYGGAAMAITNFCHRMHAALNRDDDAGKKNLTTVIGINQARDNLGRDAKYNPLKAAGGNAWKHAQLLSIGLRSGTKLKMTVQGQQQIIGKEVNWEIRKQKSGGHEGAKGMYPFYFKKHGYPFGVEAFQDIITVGIQHGVIQQAGAWIAMDDGGFQLKAQGKEKFAHEIANAEGAYDFIKSRVFQAAGLNFLDREIDE